MPSRGEVMVARIAREVAVVLRIRPCNVIRGVRASVLEMRAHVAPLAARMLYLTEVARGPSRRG